jgi:hypothetical protein
MTDFKPPFLCSGRIITAEDYYENNSHYDNPNSAFYMYASEWIINAFVNSQMHSDVNFNYSYNATHIEVGDWFVNSAGRAAKIIELLPLLDSNQGMFDYVRCRIKDVDNYLLLSDPTQAGGKPLGDGDNCYIFKSDSEGNPILDYLPPYELEVTAVSNLQSRFFYQNKNVFRFSENNNEELKTTVLNFKGNNFRLTPNGDILDVEFLGGDGGQSQLSIYDDSILKIENPTVLRFGRNIDVVVENTTEAKIDVILPSYDILKDDITVVANSQGLNFQNGINVESNGSYANLNIDYDVVQKTITVKEQNIVKTINPTVINFNDRLLVTVDENDSSIVTVDVKRLEISKDEINSNQPSVLNFVGRYFNLEYDTNNDRSDINLTGVQPSISIQDNTNNITIEPTVLDFGEGLNVDNTVTEDFNKIKIDVDYNTVQRKLTIQEDGVTLSGLDAEIFDFTNGIKVSSDGVRAVIEIDDSIQSSLEIKDDSNTISTNPNTIVFGQNLNVTANNDGSIVTIHAASGGDGSGSITVKNNTNTIISSAPVLDFDDSFVVTDVDGTALISSNTNNVQSAIRVDDNGNFSILNPKIIDFGPGLRVQVESETNKAIISTDLVIPSIDVINSEDTVVVANANLFKFTDGITVEADGSIAVIKTDPSKTQQKIDISENGEIRSSNPSILDFTEIFNVTYDETNNSVTIGLDEGIGGGSTLEAPDDGTFDDGAITGWIPGVTKISNAFDDVNEVLLKLLPPRPAPLSSKTLLIANGISTRNGSNILSADSSVDNTGGTSIITAGTQVDTVFDTTVTTQTVENFGSGNSGILSAYVNGVESGTCTLTGDNNSGTYNKLTISRDVDYPADKPGFWQSLDAAIGSTLPIGINKFELNHNETGSAIANFVVDSNTSPGVSDISLSTDANNYLYSSGVPHLRSGNQIKVSCSATNLSFETYLSSKIISITSNPNIGSRNINPGDNGLPTILPRNYTNHTFTDIVTNLSGDIHTTATFTVQAANSFANSTAISSPTKVIYMNGMIPINIIESEHTRGGSPFKRIMMANGNKPTTVYSSFANASWDSGNSTSQGDCSNIWQAVVRGGIARNEVTNYSDGTWLPVGPNYSNKSDIQYITFALKKITSNIKIEFSGNDPAGIWLKLPDIETRTGLTMPNAVNGWWDVKRQLNFPAGSYPGSSSSSDGCLKQKIGQRYECSFGIMSSADSTDNQIYIHIRLEGGQSITNITLTY